MFWLRTNHFQALAKIKLLLPLIASFEPDFPQFRGSLSLLCISVPLSLADQHFLSSLTEIRDTKRFVSKRAKAEMYSIKLNSPEDLLNLLFNPGLVIFLSNDSVSLKCCWSTCRMFSEPLQVSAGHDIIYLKSSLLCHTSFGGNKYMSINPLPPRFQSLCTTFHHDHDRGHCASSSPQYFGAAPWISIPEEALRSQPERSTRECGQFSNYDNQCRHQILFYFSKEITKLYRLLVW